MNLIHTKSDHHSKTEVRRYLAPMLTLLFLSNWLFFSVMQSMHPTMMASQSTTLLLWAGLISAIISAISFKNAKGK